MIKHRLLSRSNWKRITERWYVSGRIYPSPDIFGGSLCAYGALRIVGLTDPLTARIGDATVTTADIGYTWIGVIPEGKNFALTAMFDDQGRMLQYYFDITLRNHLEAEDPYFEDLFLDVSVGADGSVYLLDRDELDAALKKDEITKEQYDTALSAAADILRWLTGRGLPSRRRHYINVGQADDEKLGVLAGLLAPILELPDENGA